MTEPPAARQATADLASLIPGLLLSAALAAAAVAIARAAVGFEHAPPEPAAHRHPARHAVEIAGARARGRAARHPTCAAAHLEVGRGGAGVSAQPARELVAIGAPALVVVVVSTTVALFAGWWISRRLGVSEKLGLLLGVGGAICGASAVVAADTVVQAEKRDSALALGIITLLGTIGIAFYPLLARALHMTDFVYGVWDGASLHEMAQVVAAGFGVSEEAARVATVVKLVRIALLAPVVFYLAWRLRHQHREAGAARVSPCRGSS